ncbi:MAG: PadR family transcriptional regulator [Peptococcaceae bacterium]
MNAQFKKGVLELVVLISLAKNDMYGYEIVSEVSKIIEVNEGTIYPLLKRLTNEKYFETYLRESSEGPPRKYYHLTKSGTLYKDELKEEWLNFNESVTKFIMECDSHD